MNKNLEKVLYNAAASTFERLAFMFVAFEDEQDKHYQDEEPGAAAIVEFQGPAHGKLIIKVSKMLLDSIAANMLGEEEISIQQKRDALGETANVICGNVLPDITESKEAFYLNAPKIIEFSDITENLLDKCTTEVDIVLDQGMAKLFIIIDKRKQQEQSS